MWSSKSSSKKHSNLFYCEEQRNEDHKKKFNDKQKSNNFVIREVPIHKWFNVDHGTKNGSGDMSDFIKGKNFSKDINAIDYEIPELVVFIQEDHHQQYVKDICIDRDVLPKFDMNRRSDLNVKNMEAMSMNSFVSECASGQPSFKDAMKIHDFRNFMMKSELEVDSGDKFSIDRHRIMKTRSLTLREAFKKESRSFENWKINSLLRTSRSRVEFPNSTNCVQVIDTNMYRPDISYLQSLKSSDKRQVNNPYEETSNSELESESGPTSYVGHAHTSSIASHQSNDSISSSHSFAFPILSVEWSGSPVRMMEANKSQSRKHRWRKICFLCCDWDA